MARTKPQAHPIVEEWLARGRESNNEPEIEIVDSHIHLWDYNDPPYFTEAYLGDAGEAGISASVYIECNMAFHETGPAALEPVGEVEFAAREADTASDSQVAVAAGIVGWADLTLGEAVGEVLDALKTAGRGRFRGVRARATYDADPQAGYGPTGVGPGLMLRDDFRQGVAELRARGHVLDLWAFHPQLHEAADLARAFPDLPIVLNHIGGPLGVGVYASEREQVFDDWASGIADVASCSNVSVKIGGFGISRVAIVTSAGRDQPPSSDELAQICGPWVAHCLSEFGIERSLFGSNFPVDKVAMPMVNLTNAMKSLTAGFGSEQRAAFFAGNTRRFYAI
jgi:L-fuconolactonase